MIKVKDENNVDKLLKLFKEFGKKKIEVGVFGDKDSTILMIAMVQEYGVKINVTNKMRGWFAWQGTPLSSDTKQINIPERSFMRAGFDENEKKIQDYAVKQFGRLIDFEITLDQFYENVGAYAAGRIQLFLTELRNPPNTQFTIERKKSSNPLIDTGRLRQSITWRVV